MAIHEAVPGVDIKVVEINRELAYSLVQSFGSVKYFVSVKCADFLSLNGELGKFDRIVMNPPFSHGDDIKHIEHARGMLNPDGRLVAVCANGPRQRERLQPLALQWIDLPSGSFADQGTNVSAAIVVIEPACDWRKP